MSSTRIAVVSAALMLTLSGGTWTAAGASSRHREDQNTQAQRPPRDPRSPASYHRQAVELWEKAKSDGSLTMERALEVIEQATALEDRALELNAEYTDAMMFKNVLLRMKAEGTTDAATRQQLIQQANELRANAIALRKAQGLPELGWTGTAAGQQTTSAPQPMTPAFMQAIEMYQPARIGGEIKAPKKVRDVKAIYPPMAQAERVQGVVIVEAILDASGQVAAARVLRSIPLLDDAALAAVQQWMFEPPLVNGRPSPVLMTVTVNFVLQ